MIPWFQYTSVHIGLFTIQVWGFFVALGMILSMYLIHRMSTERRVPADQLLSLALKMIVYGVIGARVFHVAFYQPQYYIAHPLEILAVWHGGLSSFGGLVGAAIAFGLFYKTHKMQSILLKTYANILSFAALYGWIIGRIGCLMIHDHLGAESACPLAFVSPYGRRLDMALLEILGLLPLGIVFFVLKKKHIYHFFMPLLFVYYGSLRFILDFWRALPSFATGDMRYLGLTPAQYFAMVLVLWGIYLLQKMKKGEVA